MKSQNSLSQHRNIMCRGVEEHTMCRGRVQSITIRYSRTRRPPNFSPRCVVRSQDERERNAPNAICNHAHMHTIKERASRASRRYAAAILALRRTRDMAPTTEPPDQQGEGCFEYSKAEGGRGTAGPRRRDSVREKFRYGKLCTILY